jgi:hypothetical protein
MLKTPDTPTIQVGHHDEGRCAEGRRSTSLSCRCKRQQTGFMSFSKHRNVRR